TYGQKDFSEILRFIKFESGRRPIIWFPETAYWVSYDIDVPLFLPVYGYRRVGDLRLLTALESSREIEPIEGQLVFSSGWEWGYWLNDIVALNAAWNPHTEKETDLESFEVMLKDSLGSFAKTTNQL